MGAGLHGANRGKRTAKGNQLGTEDVTSFIQVLRWAPPVRESYGD